MLTNEDIQKLIEAQKEVFPTKKELNEKIKGEIEGLARMMKKSFDNVETRLERIENILIKDHEMRIKRIEDELVIK